MGILDDAIKEHLELKRQHGADASELKQLEDEAFGAAERPGDEEAAPDPLAEAPTEFMQQPGAAEAEGALDHTQPPAEPAGGRTEIADLQEAPEPEEPAEEESPAMEHEAVPEPEAPEAEPPAPTGPTTEEREAIAEQPTEMYDVEEELAASSQAEAPSEEELVEEEMDEPRLAPVDPLSTEDEEDEDDGEDFFDEQRLSDELDQALDAPAEPAEEVEPEESAEGGGEEAEDVLEETPDFLEESEDDQLWFEQKPPKDFDFDD